MLELVKKLFKTEADDEVIHFYIANAKKAIQTYINDDAVDVEEVYRNEVAELAAHYMERIDLLHKISESGVKSISSNGRSVSYMSLEELDQSIPDYITARLKRKVKVKVW